MEGESVEQMLAAKWIVAYCWSLLMPVSLPISAHSNLSC